MIGDKTTVEGKQVTRSHTHEVIDTLHIGKLMLNLERTRWIGGKPTKLPADVQRRAAVSRRRPLRVFERASRTEQGRASSACAAALSS